jgi:hypothetical protein
MLLTSSPLPLLPNAARDLRDCGYPREQESIRYRQANLPEERGIGIRSLRRFRRGFAKVLDGGTSDTKDDDDLRDPLVDTVCPNSEPVSLRVSNDMNKRVMCQDGCAKEWTDR